MYTVYMYACCSCVLHSLLPSQTLEALCSGLETLFAGMEEEEEEKEAEKEKEEDGEKEGEEGEEGGGSGGSSGRRQVWVLAVERAVKSTVLGGLLLPLLVVASDQAVCTLQMANMMQKSLHSLVQLAAQVGVESVASLRRVRESCAGHMTVTWCGSQATGGAMPGGHTHTTYSTHCKSGG